ncbi:cytochrome P450 714C2-like [Diospyros lotus]|uniref:cytochrome P450 714C2-like n=1 Tax=Diospyros lotus TaxID=55363 RepID=UPI002251E8A0|nr:cytochrome P450 714C2-like [Diospyros lotus]
MMEEEMLHFTAKIVLAVVLGGALALLAMVYNVLLLKPSRLRAKLRRQGVRGPSPSFLYGNIPEMKRIQFQVQSNPIAIAGDRESRGGAVVHHWPPAVFPDIEQWRNEYGPIFTYSTGNIQILCITDPEMAKEVSLCTSLSLGKPSYLSKERGALLGEGILSSSGRYWSYQRHIIAPEFYFDKVKGMVSLMVDSTTVMLKSWESKIVSGGGNAEIKVDDDMRILSADIISKACFGSNYSQGERIFLKLRAIQKTMSKGHIGVPGSRFLPTKNNRKMWRLEREIYSMISKMVRIRSEAKGEKDLLQMILDAAKRHEDNSSLWSRINSDKFIVDNCKNIYFAGHETTAISASWCLMLLAAYPEWQDRVRSEVLQICGEKLPDADMLPSMKTLTMVIQETLRLYPPAAYLAREAFQDIDFKGFQIPKGTTVQIPVAVLHHHPEVWGPDVHQFRPERFANGTLGASKIPHTFMPFGVGPRTCLGQHFAISELKVILSLILSRFSFTLSPAYQHSPAFSLVIEPKEGVILHVKRV